mmetsp:Transcript_19765/g.50498  ORF Transcript_19765/g.50498 Transcript_19765/m.50498 type:complete len:256 (+) Transcript_19765:548-1315(+)
MRVAEAVEAQETEAFPCWNIDVRHHVHSLPGERRPQGLGGGAEAQAADLDRDLSPTLSAATTAAKGVATATAMRWARGEGHLDDLHRPPAATAATVAAPAPAPGAVADGTTPALADWARTAGGHLIGGAFLALCDFGRDDRASNPHAVRSPQGPLGISRLCEAEEAERLASRDVDVRHRGDAPVFARPAEVVGCCPRIKAAHFDGDLAPTFGASASTTVTTACPWICMSSRRRFQGRLEVSNALARKDITRHFIG